MCDFEKHSASCRYGLSIALRDAEQGNSEMYELRARSIEDRLFGARLARSYLRARSKRLRRNPL